MKNTIFKAAIITGLVFIASNLYAQEGDKKYQQPDSIPIRPDTAVAPDNMPVVTPDDKNPPVPMPGPKVKDNEDGMPVKNFPDSTMNKPKR